MIEYVCYVTLSNVGNSIYVCDSLSLTKLWYVSISM